MASMPEMDELVSRLITISLKVSQAPRVCTCNVFACSNIVLVRFGPQKV